MRWGMMTMARKLGIREFAFRIRVKKLLENGTLIDGVDYQRLSNWSDIKGKLYSRYSFSESGFRKICEHISVNPVRMVHRRTRKELDIERNMRTGQSTEIQTDALIQRVKDFSDGYVQIIKELSLIKQENSILKCEIHRAAKDSEETKTLKNEIETLKKENEELRSKLKTISELLSNH
jgi:hypothetical protein